MMSTLERDTMTPGSSSAPGPSVPSTEARLSDLVDQLRQVQKMDAVGRLAGGIAHDLGNLLTVIIGASERLVDALSGQRALLKDAETVSASAERAAALTRQLLAFSRQHATAPAVLDPNAVLGAIECLFRPIVGEQVELSVHRAPELGTVRMDPTHLEQVILNLVVNARDAMPTGGSLCVETRNVDLRDGSDVPGLAPGRYVVVTVTDTGVGMDEETRARAFEPFFTTKAAGKGTGLGLSITQGIVADNHGVISIESAPGLGTAIACYLPRVDAVPPTAAGKPVAVKGGDETILVVEDEEGVRELVRDLLEAAGYDVIDAARPSVAERLCREFDGRIHLLLTDMVMPEMSGRDLAARAVVLRPDMRVLFMSGYPEHPSVPGQSIDAARLIAKPFERRRLLRAVRDALDSGAEV